MATSEQPTDGARCPTCGRTDFASENGMKQHHVQTHGESLSKRREREFVCGWCGDEFTRRVSPDETAEFCSQSCAAKNTNKARGNAVGEGAIGAKQAARDRDGYTCQSCGVEVSRRSQDQAADYEVHHLIPAAAGGSDTLENLVTLCEKCHNRAHWKMKQIHKTRPDLLEELREYISGEGDATDHQVQQSVSRVRSRIQDELPRDIEVLEEHRPDLLEELREVVCDGDE